MPPARDRLDLEVLDALEQFALGATVLDTQLLALSWARLGPAWPAWIDFVVQHFTVRGDVAVRRQLLSGELTDALLAATANNVGFADAARQRVRLNQVVRQVALALKVGDGGPSAPSAPPTVADRLLQQAVASAQGRWPDAPDPATEVQLSVLCTNPRRGFVVPLRLRRIVLADPTDPDAFCFVRSPHSWLLDVDGGAAPAPPDPATFEGGLAIAAAAVQQHLRADAMPVAWAWDLGCPTDVPLSAVSGGSAIAAFAVAAMYLMRTELRDLDLATALDLIDWPRVAVTALVVDAAGRLGRVVGIEEKVSAWVQQQGSPFNPDRVFGHRDQPIGRLQGRNIFVGVEGRGDVAELARTLARHAGDALDEPQRRLLRTLCKPGDPPIDRATQSQVARRPAQGLRSWLLRRWARLWRADDSPIGSFYVQLQLNRSPDAAERERPATDPASAGTPHAEPRRQRFESLQQMLAADHDDGKRATAWLVTGPPGCGKTVMLAHHELTMARLALQQLARHEAPTELCVPIPMKAYAAASSDVVTQLEAITAVDLTWCSGLQRLIERYPGAVRLVFDGINEINVGMSPADGTPRRTRQSAINDIVRWVDQQQHAILAPVFTIRDVERSVALGSASFRVPQAQLLPWDWSQQQAYCRQRLAQQGKGERLIALLAEAKQRDLRRLCELPMNLNYQCELFGQTERLAVSRGELFSGMAWLRLRREYSQTHDDPHRADDQDAMAPELDRRYLRWQDPGWKARILDLPQGWIVDRLEAVGDALVRLHGRNERTIGIADLRRVVSDAELPQFLRLAGNLGFGLLSDDNRFFEFAHQLWGEFFAARRLARDAGRADFVPPAGVARDLSRLVPIAQAVRAARDAGTTLALLDASPWEETVRLAVELADDPTRLVKAFTALNPPLAARACASAQTPVTTVVQDDLRRYLLASMRQPGTDLRLRVEAGLALGDIGDTLRYERCNGPHGPYLIARDEPGQEHWADIKAGTYRIGSYWFSRRYKERLVTGLRHLLFVARVRAYEGDDETPVTSVRLSRYRLCGLLVTNAEWRCFVDGEGYVADPRWWGHGGGLRWIEQAARMAPRFWDDPQLNNPLQPVVGVNWWEAQAYARWLTAQTRGHPRYGRWMYRLPTEAEWEAAARGRERHLYPWGNEAPDIDRCNFAATRLDTLSPVGAFPRSDRQVNTRQALSDMLGNGLEWTSSRYTARLERSALTSPTADEDGNRLRLALRGGHYWNYTTRGVRAAFREVYDPIFNDDVVLRLAGVPIEVA